MEEQLTRVHQHCCAILPIRNNSSCFKIKDKPFKKIHIVNSCRLTFQSVMRHTFRKRQIDVNKVFEEVTKLPWGRVSIIIDLHFVLHDRNKEQGTEDPIRFSVQRDV
jgi:hypothetical protein